MSKLIDTRNVRTYGTGHFEYRERKRNGGKITRFAFGYVYSVHPKPNSDRRHFATGKTIKEAEQRAKSKAAAHDLAIEQAFAPPTQVIPSISGAFQEFLQGKNLAESSVKKYHGWKKHLCEFRLTQESRALGDTICDQIDTAGLDKCFCRFKATHFGKSPGNFRDVLSEFWDWMVRQDYTPKNVVHGISKGSRKSTKSRLSVSDHHLRRMFETADDPRLKAVIVLGLHNLRISEILGLTIDRIKGNVVEIKRQLKPVANPFGTLPKTVHGLAKLKSHTSEREIRLSDEEMRFLFASIDLSKEHEIYDAVDRKVRTKRFVIPNKFGQRWCYNDFRLLWEEAAEQAGVEIKAHDLRRLFTTGSFSSRNTNALNPSAVSKSLGHADLETTMIYNFVDDDELAAVHNAATVRIERALFRVSEEKS